MPPEGSEAEQQSEEKDRCSRADGKAGNPVHPAQVQRLHAAAQTDSREPDEHRCDDSNHRHGSHPLAARGLRSGREEPGCRRACPPSCQHRGDDRRHQRRHAQRPPDHPDHGTAAHHQEEE